MIYTQYNVPKPEPEPILHRRWTDKPYWRLLRMSVRSLDQHNARTQAARDAKKAEVS